MAILSIEGLVKTYRAPDGATETVLDVPRLALEDGAHVALSGRSGSGKTTLLHVIAGILRADAGRIVVAGKDLAALSQGARDAHRARALGYVFQSFHLLSGYTALENVLLGMAFGPGVDRAFARALLGELGLADRAGHYPRQLSVGQQQRVALARALANRPRLVLADEPTGNLDAELARESLALMRRLCAEHGAALLCVSHSPEVLASFETRLDLSALNRAARRAGGAA